MNRKILLLLTVFIGLSVLIGLLLFLTTPQKRPESSAGAVAIPTNTQSLTPPLSGGVKITPHPPADQITYKVVTPAGEAQIKPSITDPKILADPKAPAITRQDLEEWIKKGFFGMRVSVTGTPEIESTEFISANELAKKIDDPNLRAYGDNLLCYLTLRGKFAVHSPLSNTSTPVTHARQVIDARRGIVLSYSAG